jgi:hypothetical protein
MKSPTLAKLSLVSVTMMILLLVAAPALGFSSLIPNAAASPTTTTTTTDTTTMNATTTAPTTPLTPITPPTTIDLEDEPFAESRITPVSENVINETQQIELVFEGSTTMTLPNTTETITTRDIGEGILTFIPGGGVLHGQVQLTTEDGSESAIALFTGHFNEESTTAISLVQFITNSTGILAPLNNMIAVTLDQEQPDGSILIRYFEWEEEEEEGEEGADDDGEEAVEDEDGEEDEEED